MQANRRNLAHGWLPVPGDSLEHQLGTSMPQGGHPPHHSITSSARSRIDVGNSMPIALAVLRFTTRLSGKLPSLYDPPLAPSKHLLRVSEYAGRRALEAF